MKKLKILVLLLLKANWEWEFPKKTKLLIYDATGYSILKRYIDSFSHIVLYTRGESFNFWILFFSMGKASFWKGKVLSTYITTAIQFYKPNSIITFIDNNEDFYLLKVKFPAIKTIFIQNGWRGEQADIFESIDFNENYIVDHMFVFGTDIAEKYSSYIKGNIHTIGSLRNNADPIHKSKKTIDVLFISQYLNEKLGTDEVFIEDRQGNIFTNDDFFYSDIHVIKFLSNYCQRKEKKLSILLRSNEQREKDFYTNLLDINDFNFIDRNEIQNSYFFVDISNLIVFIDSTLGYEAIARGGKVACFSIRAKTMKNDATKFGWPGKYPDEGFFWTNSQSENTFEQIIERVISCSEKEWDENLKSFGDKLIVYDPSNKRLKLILDEIV